MKWFGFGLLAIAATAASGQEAPWPSKPLKLVVPFPPNGTSDAMARMVAEKLSVALKQPVTVENVVGAGGVTGTLKALKEPGDGYTLIQSGVGQNAIAHGLDPKLGYDSLKDLVHIAQVHSGANVLVVAPNAPFKNFADLMAQGKANPNKFTYGYTPASSGHLAMELLKQTVNVCVPNNKGGRDCKGLSVVGVPQTGGGTLMASMLQGQYTMVFINQDAALPHVKAGKLRPLAVTSLLRNPLFPDVPSISEAGYPGFTALSWSGISVSSKTPKAVVQRLEVELTKIMQSPEVKQQLEGKGFVVPEQGSDNYTAFLTREIVRWGRVIKIAGIKAE